MKKTITRTELLECGIQKNTGMQKKKLALKYGFIANTYPALARLLEKKLSEFPEKLQLNFPNMLITQLSDEWYITSEIYIYTRLIYFDGNNLEENDAMNNASECVSTGKFLSEGLYATVLQNDSSEIMGDLLRLLPESRFITLQDKNIILYTDSSREDILVPKRKWRKYLFLHQFGAKINIGKKNHPADAVWWVNWYQDSGIVDNIIGSSEGKWQLLPGTNLQVVNFLSLDDVITTINKI